MLGEGNHAGDVIVGTVSSLLSHRRYFRFVEIRRLPLDSYLRRSFIQPPHASHPRRCITFHASKDLRSSSGSDRRWIGVADGPVGGPISRRPRQIYRNLWRNLGEDRRHDSVQSQVAVNVDEDSLMSLRSILLPSE